MSPIASRFGRLFIAREAAEYLGVSTSKVRNLIRRGELVAVRTEGGRLEGVYERDCDAWLATRRQAATPLNARQVAADARIDALMPATRAFS